MLPHYILRGSALSCNSLHFHVHVVGLVQDCCNSSALAMELQLSHRCIVTANLYSCISLDDNYTNGMGQFMQVYVKKYVAWLHVLITLCTSQGSHVPTLFLR